MRELSGADLEALLAVQARDSELDRCRHRKATLPERQELAAIDAELAALARREATARAAREVVASRQDGLERTLASVEGRASEVRKRLYGGTVSATRELQAMAAEVDSLEERASALESQALEAMEELEPLDADVDAIEEEKAALNVRRADVARRLLERQAEIDGEIAELSAARGAAAAVVPEELIATYERLRQHLGGTGVARLVGSRCDGCHLTLPATALDELRHQRSGTLSFCEQCGRILVPSAAGS